MTTDTNGAGGLPGYVSFDEMFAVACKAWDEHQAACRVTTPAGSMEKAIKAVHARVYAELCRATREGDGEVDDENIANIESYAATLDRMALCNPRTADDFNLSQSAKHIRDYAALLRTLSRVAVQEGMVERVARAMHASENKTSGWAWEECSPIEIEGWMELAQTAIDAIAAQRKGGSNG